MTVISVDRVARHTLADAFLPRQSITSDVGLIISGSILLAALAQIVVRLPFTPVPITGQTYGVLLIGALLGRWRGALSVVLYLLEARLGLPVLAGGVSGLAWGPTSGYLLGFVAAAVMIGWLSERGWDRRFVSMVLAMLCGEAVIYLCGLSWLASFVGWSRVFALGFWPFVPGDVAKLLLAALTLPSAWRLLASGRR